MTDEAKSALRRRMIEDMTIRKLAPKTQQGYIRTIQDFAARDVIASEAIHL
jgi:integrase/recombinase XerD